MGQPDINVYSVKITSANTDTQIFKSPWLVNRSYIIQQITLTNEGTATVVKFYDDDLSSPVPPTLGNSGAGPLLEYNVGANATLVIDRKMCPHKRFISGMVGNSSIANLHVVVEVKED